jgi:3-methyladenine DNA glycosylase AlkD
MTELKIEEITLPENPAIEPLLKIFQTTFEALSHDEDYQEGMLMAVPGVGEMYGVRVPQLRAFAKHLLKTYKGQHQALEDLARRSWEVGTREHRLVALYLLEKVKMPPEERWALGRAFLPAVDNWETCDVMCMSLQGIAVCQEPGYMDEIEGWIKDDNFWVRRAALVTSTRLRNGKFDKRLKDDLDQRTLAMCQALLYDDEKYIRKAVDWGVREVLRRNYEMARDWMMARAGEGLVQPAMSTLKLAAKKLEEGDREAFMDRVELGAQ